MGGERRAPQGNVPGLRGPQDIRHGLEIKHGRGLMKFPFLSYANWYPLGELNPCFQVENLTS